MAGGRVGDRAGGPVWLSEESITKIKLCSVC